MHVAMLDMGERKYGDATFCEIGGKKILIDGGHRGDECASAGMPISIPEQLATLIGQEPPFAFDLLVITHCHSDHIGCIPELVANGTVTAKWALVADPRMGFGVPLDEAFPASSKGTMARVAAALQEEPLPDTASDEEVRHLIDAASTLQQRYAELIDKLENLGAKVVRYGRDPHFLLEREFEEIGLNILGPTIDQLLICAHRIERERIKGLALPDRVLPDQADEVALYRALVRTALADDEPLEDGSLGAALNNQSIILKIGRGKQAVLLTGDMQFAAPGVGGLVQRMANLRHTVHNAGPYAFVRLPHHGAANGTDAALLDCLVETEFFGISTGSGDPGHPSRTVLDLLATRSEQTQWARTDRNGLVSLRLDVETPQFENQLGSISDASVSESKSSQGEKRRKSHHRVAHRPQRTSASGGNSRLEGVPRLTFVTNSARLKNRIGEAAEQALDLARANDHQVLDILDEISAEEVAQSSTGSNGIVLLGGYGVLPAFSVDTLPPRLRDGLANVRHADPDNFVVWSDDPYGDPHGRGVAEIPVSRIPDGNDGAGLLRALSPLPKSENVAFGIRNALRPFADEVYAVFANGAVMHQSDPLRSGQTAHASIDARHIYFMLHGQAEDATLFLGETDGDKDEDGSGLVDAFCLADVPESTGAVVFAGCCHGALLTPGLATGWDEGAIVDRPASESLAVSFVHAGARAFVGATGQHYSPPQPPYKSAAGPLHRKFWEYIARGVPPAVALMRAKIDYLLDMPVDSAMITPVDYKTWRQFTCLGLGW